MGEHSYTAIHNAGEAIGGLQSVQPGAPCHWASYLSVPDVDASYQAALANGAKSCLASTDFAPAGRCGIVTDPTGAKAALA